MIIIRIAGLLIVAALLATVPPLGAYLLIAGLFTYGIYLVEGALGQRAQHPMCRACGYDLFGLSGSTRQCPECGIALTPNNIIQIDERLPHRQQLWWGIALLALVIGGCVASMVVPIIVGY